MSAQIVEYTQFGLQSSVTLHYVIKSIHKLVLCHLTLKLWCCWEKELGSESCYWSKGGNKSFHFWKRCIFNLPTSYSFATVALYLTYFNIELEFQHSSDRSEILDMLSNAFSRYHKTVWIDQLLHYKFQT